MSGDGVGVGVGVSVGVAAPPANRGFTIHQKVGIDVEFSKRTLKGWTEITVVPTDPNLKIIRLNVRQCTLTHISINNKGPGSKYTDTYSRFGLHELADVSHHKLLRERLEPGLKDPLEEELVITLPKSVKIEVQQNPPTQNGIAAVVAAEEAAAAPSPGALTPGPAPAIPANTTQYTPLKVRIEFTVDNIRDGFHFVGSEDDPRLPHAYTLNTVLPGSASCIFPCVDSLWERHTWELEITCPRTLGDIGKAVQPPAQPPTRQNNAAAGADLLFQSMHPFRTDKDFTYAYGGDDSELDFVVVCTGQASDEKIDPKDASKKICSFQVYDPTAPQHIAFAVGPFEKANLTEFRESEDDDAMGVNAIEVHGFALPGRLDDVKNTCMFMQKAIDYFVRTFGMYPFSAKLFNLCFVNDLPSPTIPAASMALCSDRILFPESQIDPIYPATRLLTHALASQWSGISVIPKSWQDAWIVIGIAQYITSLFLRKLLGNNEYRFRLKKDTERLCALDVDRQSLGDHGLLFPFGPGDFDFISLKAPLVLYILDQRLRKGTNSLGLGRVLPKIFLHAFSGTDPDAALLSTANFVRGCEKVGHTKLDKFFQQWVFSSGCPRFEISQRFNKKKMIVEMIIRQVRGTDQRRHVTPEAFVGDAAAFQRGERPEVPQKLFTGPMTIRIHEADGTPYEHVVELKDWATKLEIPYNTKYKRLKRTKRQKERMAATAGADVNADAQADDGVLLYCLGDVLQNEEDMLDWQLSEWTKEQEDKMSQEAFEWIRVDADFEWLCTMTINQPDHMFLSQLQQDRDVTAQYEAVKHFRTTTGSVMRSTILVRTVVDRRYYYGIRVEAARGLATCATPELNWIGRVHLEKAFQEFYCFPNSSVPLANDFSDFTSYFVQNGIVLAMSDIRDKDGSSPLFVQRFLLNLLRYNENSNNAFADNYYVSTIMTALQSCVREKVAKPLAEDAGMNFDFEDDDDDDETDDALDNMVAEVERFQRMDQWLPSFQNVVSTSALEFKKNLILKKHRESDLLEFLAYAREGTLDVLRVKAVQCMVELGGLRSPGLLGYICTVLSDDASPYVRHETMKAFLTGLGTIATGDETAGIPSADPSSSGDVIIEDDDPSKNNATGDPLQVAINLFKRALKDNEVMQQCLWKSLSAPTIGIIEMRKLLDVCSLLYEPKRSLIVPIRYRKPRQLVAVHTGKGQLRFIWNPTKDQVSTLVPHHIRPPPEFLLREPTPPPPPKAPTPAPAPPPPPAPAFEPQPPKRQLTLKPPKDPNAAATPPTPVATTPAPPAVKEPKSKKDKLTAKIKLKAKPSPTPPPDTTAAAPAAAPAPAPAPAPLPKLKLKLNMAAMKIASQAQSMENGSPDSDSD